MEVDARCFFASTPFLAHQWYQLMPLIKDSLRFYLGIMCQNMQRHFVYFHLLIFSFSFFFIPLKKKGFFIRFLHLESKCINLLTSIYIENILVVSGDMVLIERLGEIVSMIIADLIAIYIYISL